MPVSTQADTTARNVLIDSLGPVKGLRVFNYAQTLPLAEKLGVYQYFARWVAVKAGVTVPPKYKVIPVGIKTFCSDPYYLAMGDELYPSIVPDLVAINSGQYVEAVLTGGIGSAKTTIALLTQAYQVYLLSLMENPHEVFGIDRASEIEIIFQSITEKLAESVDYCVDPQTKILTRTLNWVPAEDVYEGQQLVGFEETFSGRGRRRRLLPSLVEAVASRQSRRIRLHFTDGSSTTSSSDHRWLAACPKGKPLLWKHAYDLHPEDLVRQAIPVWGNPLSAFDAGWVSGVLDGEGWSGKSSDGHSFNLAVAQKPGKVLDRLVAVLQQDGHRFSVYGRKADTVKTVRFFSTADCVKVFGMYRPVRLRSYLWEDMCFPEAGFKTIKFVEKLPMGEVVSIQTSTKTFIADGLAAHNCRFKEMVSRSPYFQKEFPFDPDRKSEMHFPNRIIVKPVSGSNLATIGQNVISGLIDELNYMSVVDKSKRAVDSGTYDQAVALYNSISRRRKSRFYKQGRLPGVLCLVSSKKYPGQFTDVKQKEALTDPTIYVYDKRVWDIKPDSFSAIKFTVFIGDEYRKPRILDRDETITDYDKPLLIEVPDDFRSDFERDIVDALREIGGVSHLTKSPFFTQPDPVRKMFGDRKFPSIFSRDEVDFVQSKLEILKGHIRHPQFPRFAHVDLGLTGDNCGLAIGHCPGFSRIDRGGAVEIMPNIVMDGVLAIHPPKGGEIQFHKVRRLFYVLKQLGILVKWITYDSFQSLDSMQLLRQRGYIVGLQSMDKTMKPYDFFKSAIYDGRVLCPYHDLLYREMRDLQIDYKDQKVDHLPLGSKDCADACAGVVYGLTVMRDTWASHGVPISEAVVAAVQRASQQQAREQTRHDRSGVEESEEEEI